MNLFYLKTALFLSFISIRFNIFCSLNGYSEYFKILNYDTLKYSSPPRDSIKVLELAEIFAIDLKKKKFSYPYSLVTISDFEKFRFNENSIVYALSSKSGVEIQQRSLGSYRISIRGSSRRSPFGVRNTKVYLDDIPLTSAFGNTDLNNIDISNFSSTEVSKGSSSSLFGAGTGGVVVLKSDFNQKNSISAEFGYGSFGLRKYSLSGFLKTNFSIIRLSYSDHNAEGFRDHNQFSRRNFRFDQILNLKKGSLKILYLNSHLNYEIPGALTMQEFTQNPSLSRPLSIIQNSSVNQSINLIGTSYKIKLKKFSSNNSIFFKHKNFIHPFILDFKIEKEIDFGIRTSNEYEVNLFNRKSLIYIGGEFQGNRTKAKNFDNNQGLVGNIRFADNLLAINSFLFQQLSFEFSQNWAIHLSLSENFLLYQIHRYENSISNNHFKYRHPLGFNLSPRFALSYQPFKCLFFNFNLSNGFSPPSINEVRTNEGSINKNLFAESTWTYDLGLRYISKNKRIILDAQAFYSRMKDMITTYANNEGVILFRNSGHAILSGMEIDGSFTIFQDYKKILSSINLTTSCTINSFNFSDYLNLGLTNLSGNMIPGVSPKILFSQINVEFLNKGYVNLSYKWYDITPLNDENTVWQEEINLLHLRLGIKFKTQKNYRIEVYSGIDNILNINYSLGNDINAFGGRYFQPAPKRNFFLGLKTKF